MKLKGILALSLAVVLLLAISACGGTKSDPTESITSGETTIPSQTTESSEQTVDMSPITMTIGMDKANCMLGDGTHQDYKVMEEISKKTGVTLDFISYDDSKFKVLAAGNDLPDIFLTMNDAATNQALLNSGQLMELDGLLEKYGQNILNNIPTALKWARQVFGNGKIYILPTYIQDLDTSNPAVWGSCTFNARYDIYKACGSPSITDEDSFLAALKQMQDYERKQTGNDKIYALSLWTDWGTWPFIISYPIGYGYANCNYNHMMNRETQVLESQYLDEDGIFWRGIKFFNKAYQAGIFDPQGLTAKYEQHAAAATNGTLLCVGFNWLQPDKEACGENAIFAILPGSVEYIPDLYGSIGSLGMTSYKARCINAKCKYPERAMQLLNYFDSVEGARILANGIQGVDWDYVDGKPQLIGEHLEALQNGTIKEYLEKSMLGIDGDNGIGMQQWWTSYQGVKTTDGYPVNLSDTLDLRIAAATEAQKSFARDFDPSFSFPGQVYDKWVKEGNAKAITTDLIAINLMATASDTTNVTTSKANEYFMANVSKVILAKDDETFNKEKAEMIKAFKDMGLEECDAEVQKLYEDAKQLVESFMAD